jgi:hypothetical protein
MSPEVDTPVPAVTSTCSTSGTGSTEVQSSTRSKFSCSSSDVQLHQLGLGAGADRLSERKLRYLVDDTPQVLPTFGNVAQSFHMTKPPTVRFPGVDIELPKVLHASEAVSIPGRAVTRFTEIWDHGKAAVIWSETTVTTPDDPLWTQKRSIFARGEGGFGGERGPRRRRRRQTPRRISSCRCPRCHSRHRCTGCAATATRCTRIPNSLRLRDFPG